MARVTVVDWAAAIRSGQRLAPTGPKLSVGQARQAVEDLREFSARAELIVRDTTGLGHGLPVAQARVVDRPGWVAATAAGMELLTQPLTEKMAARLTTKSTKSTGRHARTGRDQAADGSSIDEKALRRASKIAGTQLGSVLAFLSGRVLGQYDPVIGEGTAAGPGLLLLVAPNVVKVERELDADPQDFRMWVCLHESTHRLQFTAVPWLRDYFRSLVGELAEQADVQVGELLKRAVAAIGGRNGSFVEAIQSPGQRAVFDRMMALMTLLEGHADHVMDAVGPSVIPSVGRIRTGFTRRRQQTRGPIDRLIRALLGLDMKMAQYATGAAFVSAVVDRVGMERFNTIWTAPHTLPTRAETKDPDAWITRVLS